jgi:hypothetical protein
MSASINGVKSGSPRRLWFSVDYQSMAEFDAGCREKLEAREAGNVGWRITRSAHCDKYTERWLKSGRRGIKSFTRMIKVERSNAKDGEA